MIELPYSLVIEATEELDFFTYFSPDLPGFSGVADSVQDCIDEAKLAMAEHTSVLAETNRSVPPVNEQPTIVIQNAERVDHAV